MSSLILIGGLLTFPAIAQTSSLESIDFTVPVNGADGKPSPELTLGQAAANCLLTDTKVSPDQKDAYAALGEKIRTAKDATLNITEKHAIESCVRDNMIPLIVGQIDKLLEPNGTFPALK